MGAWILDDHSTEPIALDVLYFSASGQWLGILNLPTKHNRSSFQVSGLLVPGGGPPTETGEPSHTLYMKIGACTSGAEARLPLNTPLHGHLNASMKTLKVVGAGHAFALNYLRHFPAAPLAFLQPGTQLRGTAGTDVALFQLHIDKTIASNFAGTMTWPDLGVTTSLSGQVQPDGTISFSETGIVSKPDDEDVDVPNTSYTCRPNKRFSPEAATTHRGTWTTKGDVDVSKGVFMMTQE